MKAIVMHQICNFIYNSNIDLVKEIYQNKVPNYMLAHLIDKKNEYKEFRNNNAVAWLDFIGNLDEKNSEILFDYIINKE